MHWYFLILLLGAVFLIVGYGVVFISSFLDVNVSGSTLSELKFAFGVRKILFNVVPLLAFYVVFWIFPIKHMKRTKKRVLFVGVVSVASFIFSIFFIPFNSFVEIEGKSEEKLNNFESGEYSNYIDSLKQVSGVSEVKLAYQCKFPNDCLEVIRFQYHGSKGQIKQVYEEEISNDYEILQLNSQFQSPDYSVRLCNNSKKVVSLSISEGPDNFTVQIHKSGISCDRFNENHKQ